MAIALDEVRLLPVLALLAGSLLAACSEGGGTGVVDSGGDPRVDDAAPDAVDLPDEPLCGTERLREDIGIATIDGYELAAWLDRPAREECPLPTILIQTPYDKESAWRAFIDERAERPLFDSPHYNYVVVDWRGRFGSSGLPHGGEGPWLAQDAYDTVEWIAAQPWSDGEVGTWGVSALCGAQYRTAAGPSPSTTIPDFAEGPPPHLGAMVPIFCAMRTSYGGVYPGGVLRHEWAMGLDVLGFGLRAIYESIPRRTLVWDVLDAGTPADRMRVPALVVAGWWDLLPNASIAAFHELVSSSDPSVREAHRLLIGPWIHFAAGGATTEGGGRPLTEEERSFMDLDREIDRRSLAFFDHHLRGLDNGVSESPRVRFWQNEGLHGGAWHEADSWPPAESEAATFYLNASGLLTEEAPANAEAEASWLANPANPSPTIGGATLSPYNCFGARNPLICSLTPNEDRQLLHGPTSQAAVLARDDRLYFTTEAVEAPLTLLGSMRFVAEIATTGTDADLAIRVVDVDAAGETWLIGEGVSRLTARVDERSWDAVTPGERYELTVALNKDFAYTLPAGHRLGVIVTASNWPLYARNPQDGAVFVSDDVASATPDTFRWGVPATELALRGEPAAATITLHLGGLSRIELGLRR